LKPRKRECASYYETKKTQVICDQLAVFSAARRSFQLDEG
jgi:hypothetical protein